MLTPRFQPRTLTLVWLAPALLLTLTVRCTAQDVLASDADVATAFPEIYNSETVPGDPISPEDALAALTLPEGFTASLFAAEPMVQNPIATTIDPKGRVWIAENYTYAERAQKFDLSLNDRVIVLEDTNHDGQADKRTVFADNIKMLTGITTDSTGVWLMCPPRLLFIPDADGDLIPDGPPQVKLDGFHVANQNYHNFANGLSWGPDSWLYGRCGASCPGDIGVPGSVPESRVPIQGGMWRFNPKTNVAEVLTHGTTNPWGHDWNEFGDLFFINTVNGHLWHAITGAHFVRPHTLDTNPYSYELIDMHADHWHFDTGKSWTASRDGAANDYGGGHAHIGMMINHNADWPDKYLGRLFTVNMHGRRINTERLEAEGSGYVGRHESDFLLSDDTWFRGMEIAPCHDGSVLLFDWSDTGECHDHTGVHRTSGRIFKIQYGHTAGGPSIFEDSPLVDSPVGLALLQIEGNEWQARHARRLLRDLHLNAPGSTGTAQQVLSRQLNASVDTVERLRALWGLVAIEAADAPMLLELLNDPDAQLRSWAIRLLTDNWPLDHGNGKRLGPNQLSSAQLEVLLALVELSSRETSPAVRLTLASTLARLPYAARPELAGRLMLHAQDASDHNLPLMVWYALAPLGDGPLLVNLNELLDTSTWSKTRRLMARRVADQVESQPELFERLFATAAHGDLDRASDILLGVSAALAGRKKIAEPQSWQAVREKLAASEDNDVSQALQNLGVLFGDGRTINDLVKIARNGKQPLELRISALQSLVDARADGLKQLCLELLKTRFLNAAAAEGLAELPDADIAIELIKNYQRFHPSQRSNVISILTTRDAWAASLLQAVSDGAISRDEITAFQARQIASLEDPSVNKLLLAQWGQVRETSREKRELIEQLRTTLSADVLAQADQSQGRAIFQKSCSACHTLFGEGGKLGPDLTGAQRSNLDYLLENIVDPSAVVTAQFRATSLLLNDDRVLTGLLTNQTQRAVTLATQERTFTIPIHEIAEQKLSANSTMPDGLLTQLSAQQIRNLFSYLQSTTQIPLPQ